MRTLLGLILVLLGGAVALIGIGMALLAFASLYQGALADPLNQPDGAEKAVGDAMWRWAMIGVGGLAPFLLGSVLLKMSLFHRLSKRGR